MTSMSPSPRSTWAPPAAGSSSAGSVRTSCRSRRWPGSRTARSSGRTGCTGTSRRSSSTAWPACARRDRWRASAWTRGRSTTGCCAAASCSTCRGATATGGRRRASRRCTPGCVRRSSTAAPGCSSCPFNTIYQLAAEQQLAEAEQLLLVPGPRDVVADRPGRLRAHQRLHDRAARRPHPRLGPRAAGPGRRRARAAGRAGRPRHRGRRSRRARRWSRSARTTPRRRWSASR